MAKNPTALPRLSVAATRSRATHALRTFGETWNKRGKLPAAPNAEEDDDEYLEGWAKWHVTVTNRAPLERGE